MAIICNLCTIWGWVWPFSYKASDGLGLLKFHTYCQKIANFYDYSEPKYGYGLIGAFGAIRRGPMALRCSLTTFISWKFPLTPYPINIFAASPESPRFSWAKIWLWLVAIRDLWASCGWVWPCGYKALSDDLGFVKFLTNNLLYMNISQKSQISMTFPN